MADSFGINGAGTGAATTRSSGAPSASQAAEAAANLPAAPTVDRSAATAATTYVTDGADGQVHSRTVARLLQQNATIYGPGLARIPLPPRPDDVPRGSKKPAGPMVEPRSLDGGNSPLASGALADARGSVDAIGGERTSGGESTGLEDARNGAWRMPSRHGLVAYTTNARGNKVYLTQERWLHIRENHMDATPQPRGKRTTTYWPTRHAVDGPSMTDDQVIGVIVDAARKGTLRTEVRDTRMAEYDLPAEQRDAYGVSEAKVSMAPDGLVLSAYPGAGDNVLAVYEMNEADQADLARASAQAQAATTDATDQRMFRTNVASTTFG